MVSFIGSVVIEQQAVFRADFLCISLRVDDPE